MATDLRRYVHGISYIDQRFMMMACSKDGTEDDRPFYYVVDRMNDVRLLLDAAGAIVESYSYDPYGKPLIRECAGEGDMTGDSIVGSTEDWDRFVDAYNCDIFDPRGDIDGDGDVDRDDETLFYVKAGIWDGSGPSPVRMARSLVGNPYMFQGRPNFVFVTNLEDEHPELTLNDHRNRFADPMTGRWLTRDPIGYMDGMNLYEMMRSNAIIYDDPEGEAVPFLLVGGAGLTTAQAVAASFGLSLATCMVTPACRDAVVAALNEGVRDASDAAGNAARALKDSASKTARAAKKKARDLARKIRARLRRTGNCTAEQHAMLQADVDSACKGPPSACPPSMTDCGAILGNLRRNTACVKARNIINTQCFGGGNQGHQLAVINYGAAAAKCVQRAIANNCFRRNQRPGHGCNK